MSYRMRIITLILIDIILISSSVMTSYLFRFPTGIPALYQTQLLVYALLYITIAILAFMITKLYHRVWHYASIRELVSIVIAVTISCFSAYILTFLLTEQLVPLTILMNSYETTLFLIGGSRLFWRVIRHALWRQESPKNDSQKRVLMIGAGDCAQLIMREIQLNRASGLKPIAFIDDDVNKHQLQFHGLPIVGGREKIQEAVEKYQIEEIIIAIPSASKVEIQKLIEICVPLKAKLKIIPKINDFISGKVSLSEIRNVEVEDLLGRESVQVDLQGITSYVKHKTVLVTGAGGSIGSELCRQIATFHPKQLLLLGHGENSIYHIEMELVKHFPQLHLETIIADVQDQARIEQVFATYRPQIVFHAAAHKHVPLMERNPAEAIKNNVIGTRNVAEAANQYESERFILISTDKAVNPTSVMGATKRIAEMVIHSINEHSKTIFAAVRFGNVLGSNGSVIPLFKQQIQDGGPVTVTHPEMTRYFMTIPEAVQLVIQAGAYARGGDIFILDMGQPVKIVDLAHNLIRLSGFEPDRDIAIVYTGIRPGEKLFEEILTNEEGLTSTLHNRIFTHQPMKIESKKLEMEIRHLEKVLGEDQHVVREMLNRIVPSYQEVG
jgi:FlaA1/EpsC-like NDP-sugar epimerase